jgi:hypothetical protein
MDEEMGGNVACMRKKIHTKLRQEILKGREHIEDVKADGIIILKCISRNGIGGCGLD